MDANKAQLSRLSLLWTWMRRWTRTAGVSGILVFVVIALIVGAVSTRVIGTHEQDYAITKSPPGAVMIGRLELVGERALLRLPQASGMVEIVWASPRPLNETLTWYVDRFLRDYRLERESPLGDGAKVLIGRAPGERLTVVGLAFSRKAPRTRSLTATDLAVAPESTRTYITVRVVQIRRDESD